MAKKIEMLNDQQEVVHPLTSSDCVIMENGKTLEEVMGDGIATPTVTHEGASFQVGVGDSNIEVVDGDVAGMTLEGQTYQNILPKPTTLIMETDEKEFKINDKIDNNIVLDDNVAEIATIKGQTYVNAVQEESASEYVAIDEELNGQSITTTGKPEGYVKNATLEGLTLVNTIQQPSGADATVLELDADIDAQYATIDNTVQGGIHGAKLNGMTLVNLVNQKKVTMTSTTSSYEWINHQIRLNSSLFKAGKSYLYSSTYSYTNSAFDGKNPIFFIIRKNNSTTEKTFTQAAGEKIFTIPTDFEETDTLYIRFHASLGTAIDNTITCDNIMVIEYQEGMENWDIPYFEGMKSVEVPSVKTTGKNLATVSSVRLEGIRSNSGGHLNNIIMKNISVEEGKTYTISGVASKSNNMKNITFTRYEHRNPTNSNNHSQLFNEIGTDSDNTTFTIPKGVKYVSFTFGNCVYNDNGEDGWLQWDSIQIEEGSTATSYEPYQSSTLTTSSDVVLRKVGDVQDELDLETGKLTQRIGEVIVDNNKNWDIHTINQNTILFASYGCIPTVPSDDLVMLSDKYVIKKGFPELLASDEEQVHAYQDRAVYIRVLRTKLPSQNVDGLKQWLSNNPFTIQYKEKTPIVKTISTTVKDQSNNSLKTIQTHPTLTHVSTSSQGLIPNIVIPSQLKYPTIIKPSTQYTLKLKRDVVDSANQLTVNVGGVSTSVTSDLMTITTLDTLTSQDVIFTGKNNVISKLQLIEGDVTSVDYPYFEGMKSVEAPSVKTTGKNLFDGKFELNNGLYSYTKFSNKLGDYTLSLTDKDVNVDISGIYFGFSVNGVNADDGVYWCIGEGTVIANSRTHYSARYLSIYPNNQEALDKLTSRFNIQLEQGSSATTYEPYKGVTIEQDIDYIPLTSTMFEQNAYITFNAIKGMSLQQIPQTTNVTNRIRSKTLIKVKPNTTYQTLSSDITYSGVAYFDKNGAYINVVAVGTNNEFKTSSNTYYVALNVKRPNDSDIIPSDIPSDLVLQEVTDEIVLRSIGDVKDTLNLTTGEYVQRIGEVVLDGSAYWDVYRKDYHGVGKSTFQVYCTRDIPKTFLNDKIYCDILCQGDLLTNGNANVNKYPCNYIHNYTDATYTVNRLFVSVNKEMFGCTSNDDYDTCFVRFKAWLEENPITVQYKLATPIIKKVNLTNTTKLPSYASTTHYDTIVPSNSLIPNITLPSTIDYNVAIKPSTQYTIRANTTSAMSVDLGGSTGTLTDGKVTLTTPSTLAHNSLKLGNGKAKEVMVIEGNEIKDNIPFFNGMKNVQMGGIKLVNIARGATIDSNKIIMNANKTQFTYTSTGGSEWCGISFDVKLLKPNTLYTVYMNIVKNTLAGNASSAGGAKICLGDSGNKWLEVEATTGIYCKTMKTTDRTVRSDFGILIRPNTEGQQLIVKDFMVFEGDWTHLDEIPFIESEMIIEQPIIRSQGKNLVLPFNNRKQNSINGLTITSTSINGTPSHGGFAMLQKIYLDKDKEYWLSYSTRTGNSCRVRLRKVNSSKDIVVANIFTNSTNGSLRVSETGYYYLTIENNGNTIDSIEISNLQLEEGSTATTYEPFKQHTLSSNRVIGYEKGVVYEWSNGSKFSNTNMGTITADVEGLSVAYVSTVSSHYSFWDKDGVFISGKQYLDSSLSMSDKNGFITVPSKAKYMKCCCIDGIETEATVTGELPLRSLPNGVCDSFNLVTGEYVQRIREIVLDGSQKESYWTYNDVNKTYRIQVADAFELQDSTSDTNRNRLLVLSDRVASKTYNDDWNIGTFTSLALGKRIVVRIDGITTVSDLTKHLSQNPITVQYELATPIVRKIGLTAKGNYKEITLDGSENWNSLESSSITTVKTYFAQYFINVKNASNRFINIFNDKDFPTRSADDLWTNDIEGMSHNVNGHIQIRVAKDKLDTQDINGFKRWLSQHPMKVGYLTNQTSTTYSNILKPIFFNDVKVQFMNDNVDIQPTLTLQSRSRNSYVMDMMKANTTYTLKALVNPNSFTIDGTSYGVTTNGTFTSPSTLTNKLLITGQDVQELMIIEGDVTGKQLPYYKGIRSSFDNTYEVEVLSTGKNLLNLLNENMTYNGLNKERDVVITDNTIKISNNVSGVWQNLGCIVDVKPNTRYSFSVSDRTKTDNGYNLVTIYHGNTSIISTGSNLDTKSVSFTTPSDCNKITIRFYCSSDNTVIGGTSTYVNPQLEESPTATPYQPHKENSTIINMPTQLETVEVVKPIIEVGSIAIDNGQNSDNINNRRSKDYTSVESNMTLTFMNGNTYRAENVYLYDINKNYISTVYTNGSGDLIIPKDCYFIRFSSGTTNTSDISVIKKQYKPIALNSLPNGVKDELIINRVTSSAKLIQRVGKVVLDGQDIWGVYTVHDNNVRIQTTLTNCVNRDTASQVYSVCDKLPSVPWNHSWLANYNLITVNVSNIHLQLADTSLTKQQMLDWLKQNPITVYYELAEPVVTEISLKGYPYVYKDGLVQLNTEIPHTTKVKYNVNQEHLINGQNETIIRHDKQIDNLYDYIELYLEEEYRMELFRMQLELSL